MFQNNGDHVTISLNIPFAVGTLHALAVAGGFALFVVVLLYVLNNWRDLLGKLKRWHDKPVFNAVIWAGILLFPVWLALLVLTLTGTFELWFNPPDLGSTKPESITVSRLHFLALVGLMTALAGLIGAPLALIRVFSTERQVKATEEGLLTDRINKAVEGLGAEKTVKQVHETPQYRKDEDGEWIRDENGDPVPALRPDGQPIIDRQVVERSVPNLEVRIGAIYALERIAKLNLSEHIQIMEILTAYIRENAPAKDVSKLPEAPEYFEDEYNPISKWEEGLIRTWAGEFKRWQSDYRQALTEIKLRADVQVALTVIGRRTKEQKALERGAWKPFEEAVGPWPDWPGNDGETNTYRQRVKAYRDAVRAWLETEFYYRLDLRGCDLRNADVAMGDFSGTRFDETLMQGAIVTSSQMQNASLTEVRMQVAVLTGTGIQGSNLTGARAQGADLTGTWMQGAVLTGIRIQGTDLDGARMETADLGRARMQGADLTGARMQGAQLWHAQMQQTDLTGARMQDATLWNAQMQGADLTGTRMQGADIRGTDFDSETDFTAAMLDMAAAQSAAFAGRALSQSQIDSLFGDASTVLPDGFSRPAHWPDFDMDVTTFNEEWRKWKANPDAYVPPQTPDAD